ncbi:Uncharacterized conserved protein [Candidatus Ornithobacterium hominis]|uniref:Uncharacterized conserved protein n=1 Tax=Candidatus Ornithobacterium hominis TaxID=2497989 RepID=A0A383U3A2_9FLAO|nr:DUF262 domain-containing protein [Candidatus Ornithobacterium hominis]MCT7904700.1 DUF262 domain-containing protein [Candidatus Ornithobacterium hominis]SZD73958.1 Uncharacterized conserved protein [Candidatus Ornithobacterium hominis]
MSNISIKPINELLQYNFFIPSYQRGYRWTEKQVTDLLNDIWDFIETDPTKEEWYCLQPIVIKQLDNKKNVIDGQQRLTTIFLVLKYLEKFIESDVKTFQLEYETRNTTKSNSKDFLNKIEQKTEKEALDNIDYYHIYKAFETVKKWFKNKANIYSSVSSKFITPFLEKTKVIWYNSNEEDAVEIFTRINSGKIPLTSAELIKALFLNSSNFKTKDGKNDEEQNAIADKIRLKQLEIANEWDYIETTLHNEEFWWFINKDENSKETRIEFIFELLVGLPKVKNKKNKDFKDFEEYYKETDDTYYTFRKYAEKFKIKSENEINNNWKEVKRCFQTLQDWFNNRELYHKIGFLITIGHDIKQLIEKSQLQSKTEFLAFIEEEIINTFSNIQLENIQYNNKIIRPLLLLHNIQTMLNNTKENSRFPFNRYKNEKWDIEHIHAKASEAKVKEDIEDQRDWLSENFEKDENVHNNEDLNKRINNLINKQSIKKDDNFQELIEYVLGEEDDSLRNLCLLDRGTNRSYKNDSFKKKRKKIIEQEKKGTFIPICSKNVFMKYYSDELKQLGQWSEIDRSAYSANIIEVLKEYLPKQND